MKDIPMFSTENGVASLVLKEIPYTARAYITLRSSVMPEALLEECVQFCRMCGGEELYATGHDILEKYPLHTSILEMRCDVAALPESDAALFPVQELTAAQWREIYNEKMKNVPNAAWMAQADCKEMLQKGDGYFVHRDGKLLGIGRASMGKLDAVAAVEPGTGREVTAALCRGLCGDEVRLEVASNNIPAVKLYEKLGFLPTKEISRWYRIM